MWLLFLFSILQVHAGQRVPRLTHSGGHSYFIVIFVLVVILTLGVIIFLLSGGSSIRINAALHHLLVRPGDYSTSGLVLGQMLLMFLQRALVRVPIRLLLVMRQRVPLLGRLLRQVARLLWVAACFSSKLLCEWAALLL